MRRSSVPPRLLRGGFVVSVARVLLACGSAYTGSWPDAGPASDASPVGVVTDANEDATAARPEDAATDGDVDARVDGGHDLVLFIAMPARRAEVTSVADADALCMSRLPQGVVRAKALLVGAGRRACQTPNCENGAGEHKDWPLLPSTTYTRADRTTVIGTTNALGLFETLSQSIGTDNSVFAWTGLNTNGSNAGTDWTTGDTCSSWSTTVGTTGNGPYGIAAYTGPSYTHAAFGKFEEGCTRNFVFYCVEIAP